MIGERIRETREKNGFTQSALAKKFRISRSAVNAWEMGVSVPSAQYLVELSRLFKVSTDYLLGLDRCETVDISSLEEDEKDILYALLNLFEKNRRAVKILNSSEYARLEEDYDLLKSQGTELPEHLSQMLENLFG